MVKLSVNETKWSGLPARTRALILYITISIFDFGPEKLPGLSRNGPQSNERGGGHERMTRAKGEGACLVIHARFATRSKNDGILSSLEN